MKVGKRLTAFFLAGMLILTSNVTGFAEETTADQQPEEAKSTYLLTGEILTDKVYDEIFDGCPREKEQALEEVLRSISRLY